MTTKKEKIQSRKIPVFLATLTLAIMLSFHWGFPYDALNLKNYEFLKSRFGSSDVWESGGIVNENSVALSSSETAGEPGRVAGEEDEKKSGTIQTGFTYKAASVSVGGSGFIIQSGENAPLEISDMRSESFISPKEDGTKLIVYWKTNKMATSELVYSRQNGQNEKVVSEENYGLAHSAVISGLDPGTPYTYRIRSFDRWANEHQSELFGVFTASKPVSVFDLISKAATETFGWAVAR